MIFYLTYIRIKQVIRGKEFYYYVIGFPLFFLILFGFLSSSWVPRTSTIQLGYYSADVSVNDPLLNTSVNFSENFSLFISQYVDETGVRAFDISNYSSLNQLQVDITNQKIAGGIELPASFSAELDNITLFYSCMLLVNYLSNQFSNYSSYSTAISQAINKLTPFLSNTAELKVIFHGDISIESTMRAYSTIWKIISNFVANSTEQFSSIIWKQIKLEYSLPFDFNASTLDSGTQSISYNVSIVDSETGKIINDFRKQYMAKLLPGQIIQTILMSTISAIWIVDSENEKGIIKRLKLTKLSSFQYLGSIILAWSFIALLQGFFMISISALLGFFSFKVSFVVWLFMIMTLALLGIMSATIALFIGSFVRARAATPILVLVATTLTMFVGEYFFNVPISFTYANKNFTWLDIFPIRPAFLVMKNGLLMNTANVTSILFDFVLVILWTILIVALGVFFFSKYKLKYVEKE